MKTKRLLSFILIFSIAISLNALDISDPYNLVSEIFMPLVDTNAGLVCFPTLLIPGGGRSEAIGSAFTALANDIGFFETNPSGSSTMKNTEIALFHNSWIADSRLETISYTTRFNTLGIGASLRSFYVPFTEYNTFGERVSRGYYSESLATLNIAKNFFAGYYFKGIAVGANLKAGLRSVPNFTDNYGNLQKGSGLGQSAVAIMGDFGLQTRFNFIKLYRSKDPNFHLGLSLRNFGPPVLGEPLPSITSFGVAWKLANHVTFSAEVQQPINLIDVEKSGKFSASLGFSLDFASFYTLLGGIQIKGGNPRISLGGEINVKDIQFNVNYTLDLTTQLNALNRISLAAKLNLGDKGRESNQKKVENYYIEGMRLYARGHLLEAIDMWNAALEIDNSFDPAIESIKVAEKTLKIQQEIFEIQLIDD